MEHQATSLRPFIGAADFEISRRFYIDFGFNEYVISPSMSYFQNGNIGFYLQDYYNADWVNNTMLFLEVPHLDDHFEIVAKLDLPRKYPTVQVKPIRALNWGREYFVHDPAGILWHIGEFTK